MKHYQNKYKLAWMILTDKLCRNLLLSTLRFADKNSINGGYGSSDSIWFISRYFHNDVNLND